MIGTYDEFDEELDEQYDEDGNVAELCFDHDSEKIEDEDEESEEQETEVEISSQTKLLKAFREELERLEPYRRTFSIVYKGDFKVCKPIKELENERFIVLIEGKLHAVNIKDII